MIKAAPFTYVLLHIDPHHDLAEMRIELYHLQIGNLHVQQLTKAVCHYVLYS